MSDAVPTTTLFAFGYDARAGTLGRWRGESRTMSHMMRCPHCGKHLKADLEKIGQKVGCNACRKPFVHPGVDELIARVKFSGDPASAAKRAAEQEAELAAVGERSNRRSAVGLAAGLACVVVTAVLLFAYRNREAAVASAGHSAAAYTVAELDNPGDLASIEAMLADDRRYPLHLSSEVSRSGMEIHRATNRAVLNYRTYQATGLHVAGEELRRLLEESRAAGRKPELVVARSDDARAMLFLSKIYVSKPGLAGWMREVRNQLRVSPPFTISAAIDVDDNLYLELTPEPVRSGGNRSDD